MDGYNKTHEYATFFKTITFSMIKTKTSCEKLTDNYKKKYYFYLSYFIFIQDDPKNLMAKPK